MKNVKIIDIRLIPLNKTKKCEYSFKAVYFSEKEIITKEAYARVGMTLK